MGKHLLRPLLGHGQKPLRPVLGHGQTASSSFAGSWANTLFVLCWVMGKHPLRPLLGHGQTPSSSFAVPCRLVVNGYLTPSSERCLTIMTITVSSASSLAAPKRRRAGS